jgi:hypothetical protein
MPEKLICCVSLPPATISSVPIYDFAIAHEELAIMGMEHTIHVAERVFVKGASTPFVSLGTMRSVLFAILTELARQKKIRLKK